MPTPIPIPSRSPWVKQFLVVAALLNREVATRFGEYRLGFFWMLFEPLLGVIIIGVIIGSIAGRTVPEIPYPFFLLNGMLFLKLFTGPMNVGLNAISANQGLLVYPNVRALDPFIARFVFELLTTAFSFALFCIVGMWMGINLSLANLHILVLAGLFTWLAGCGLGLIFGVAVAHYKEVDKIVPVLQRPLLFVSCVLAPLSAIPGTTQTILLYNPLVHNIEQSRNALFPYYSAQGTNLFYPAACSIVLLSIGLTLFHNNRNFLSQR